MSMTFFRLPIAGGDLNAYDSYCKALWRRGSVGELSAKLVNNAGLQLSPGTWGINDGTYEGSCENSADYPISLGGLTVGQWAAVEASISGTLGIITITSMGGSYTDESLIPANLKGAGYDYLKKGYYLTGTKRLLGCAYIKAGPTLGRIINCENGILGFKGIRIENYFNESGVWSTIYIDSITVKRTTTWNMDTDTNVFAATPYTINAVRKVTGFIMPNSLALTYPLNYVNLADGTLEGGCGWTGGSIVFWRKTGGLWDLAVYNAAPVWAVIEFQS